MTAGGAVLLLPAPSAESEQPVALCAYLEPPMTPGSPMIGMVWDASVAGPDLAPYALVPLTDENRRRLVAAGFTLEER